MGKNRSLVAWIARLSWVGGTAVVLAFQSSNSRLNGGQLQRQQRQQRQAVVPSNDVSICSSSSNCCPLISPASGLENRFYTWCHGQQIRYQCTDVKDTDGRPSVLLIHGLFVNCDHWRRTMIALQDAGYNAYTMDLLGCGYSDKPDADSKVAQLCNGETRRFVPPATLGAQSNGQEAFGSSPDDNVNGQQLQPRILENVVLGSSNGRDSRTVNVDLCHPLGSPYNFYTWADQINDFCQDVILPNNPSKKVSLVANSIGTMSTFQAIIDRPDLFTGAFIVCPNFRELHSAEIPLAKVTMPLVRRIQELLRGKLGQGLFDALATPSTVQTILKEPYYVTSAVDDALVQALLDPLLTPGASRVVFDTLSYSAGPLPEQQLQEFPNDRPVWVLYGDKDPWTPGPRVESLIQYEPVTKVVELNGVGHCPHDEAPELVNPLLLEFLSSVVENR